MSAPERVSPAAFFEVLPDLLVIMDERFEVLLVNHVWERVLGRSIPDPVGRALADHVHPDDRAELLATLDGVGEEPVEQVLRWQHADGGHRLLWWTFTRREGNVFARARDITVRRGAEQQLELENLRSRAALEAAVDAVITVESDGRIESLNPAARAMFGYPGHEAISMPVFDLIPGLTPFEQGMCTDSEGAAPAAPLVSRLTGRRRDGSEFPLELSASAMALGHRRLVTVIARDVTERVQAEQLLQQRQRTLDAIFHASPDAIKILDPDMRIKAVSTGVTSIHGVGAAEPVGRNPLDIVHPDEREVVERELRRLLDGQVGSVNLSYRTRHCDGHYVHVDTRAEAWRDDDGTVGGAIVVERDNTSTVQATEALLAAKVEAERANEAKSEFLSRMSHELRTPLNSVIGFTQILASEDLTEDQLRCLDFVLKAGRHLLGLINEILEISRIEAGHLSLSLEPVSLLDLVDECLAIVEPSATARGIEMSRRPGAGPTVLADPQRLKQVVLNLLSNAIKFNNEDGVIHVCHEVDGDRVRLQVIDSGPGIDPVLAPRLFVAFERLHADHIEGTGLGLALSARLMEAMAGTLVLQESAPGRTVFTAELGAAEAPAASPAPVPAQLSVNRDERLRGTVLYIEDNLANIELVAYLVQSRPGIRLLTAMSGSLGLELSEVDPPDLVLLDVQMPGMDGEQVLERFRARPELDRVPIVMLSADATATRQERLLALGATAYMTKPFEPAELLSLLDEHLPVRQPVE